MVPAVWLIAVRRLAGEGVEAGPVWFRATLQGVFPTGSRRKPPLLQALFAPPLARCPVAFLFCVGLICLLIQEVQAALPPVKVSDARTQYLIRSWQVEDGMPRHSVRSLFQTRSGYLWLGTY